MSLRKASRRIRTKTFVQAVASVGFSKNISATQMTTIKTALFSVSVRNISQRKDLMVQGFFSSGEETVPSRSMNGLQGKGSAPPSSSLAATTAFAYFCSFGSPGYLFEALTNWSCDRSSKVDPLKAPPAITRRPCLALIECISGAPVSIKRAWSNSDTSNSRRFATKSSGTTNSKQSGAILFGRDITEDESLFMICVDMASWM